MPEPIVVSESRETPKIILNRLKRKSPDKPVAKTLPSQALNEAAPEPEPVTPEVTLSAQTLAEMEAGRKALEKYKLKS